MENLMRAENIKWVFRIGEKFAEVSQWEMDVAAIMAVPSADWDLPSIQAEHYAQGFADGYKRGMKDADVRKEIDT